MNNAQITIDTVVTHTESVKEKLHSEEGRLVKIVEALQDVQKTKAWSTLKTEIFDSLVTVLEKDLKTEAEKIDTSASKLNRISGELKWARRFSDLAKLEGEKRAELQRLRLTLYGKESE